MLTAGQMSDVASAADLITDLPEGAMLLADKGYDATILRTVVTERKAWANIPPKANRKDPMCFNPFLYKARNLVERFFNKAKHFRRIATRYDKLAENYLAALKLVCVRIGYAVVSLRPRLAGGKDMTLVRQDKIKRIRRGRADARRYIYANCDGNDPLQDPVVRRWTESSRGRR